jgi:hypothetical protein
VVFAVFPWLIRELQRIVDAVFSILHINVDILIPLVRVGYVSEGARCSRSIGSARRHVVFTCNDKKQRKI